MALTIIGIILFCATPIVAYFCVAKKLTKIKEQQICNQQLIDEKQQLNEDINCLQRRVDNLQAEKYGLSRAIEDTATHLQEMKLMAEASAEDYYNKTMENTQIKLEKALEQEALKFQQATLDFEEQYLLVQADLAKETQITAEASKVEIEKLQEALNSLTINVNQAVEANKRAEEMKIKDDFYKLNLSKEDLKEIEVLRSVEPLLRNPDALNKVIWECYYKKPYSDMIGRVVGKGIRTGIYKITNLDDQRVYVGQALNIAERWRQHIRRGVGAEAPTRNKLYPAMKEIGVENFTFEILEDCDREKLNEREKYWIEYFSCMTFGYNMKVG